MTENYLKLILDIADSKEVDLLPDSLKNEILEIKEKKLAEIKRKELEAELERKAAEKKAKAKFLKDQKEFLKKGTWAENIPLEKRFVLIESTGYKFSGFPGEEEDSTKWIPQKEFTTIDLVRGYMNPYFGYYRLFHDQESAWYKNRLKPIFENKDDEKKLISEIISNWNFFHINDHNKDRKFKICRYIVDKDDTVRIIGYSEEKTWEEHLNDLKKEFSKEENPK